MGHAIDEKSRRHLFHFRVRVTANQKYFFRPVFRVFFKLLQFRFGILGVASNW